MLLLVGLACLFPLSLYCLFLALVHHRRTPTMLSGAWDFAAVLLGLSGFLIVGTSVFLLALNPYARAFFLEGGTAGELYRIYRHGSRFTFLLWALFFLTLAASFAFVIWQRRFHTVIYHATPFEVEILFRGVLERMRLTATRRGPRWYIGYETKGTTPDLALIKPAGVEDQVLLREFDVLRKAVVDIDGSSALRYVNLHWRFATSALRREIENELNRDLAGYPASESGIGGWLLTITASSFILLLFCLITFLILSLR